MTNAYTAKTRPQGAPAIWATDATMDDPGQPWDAAPTKTRPTAPEIAAGFLATERPAADVANWKLNDQDRRLAALDMIEARTFVEPTGPAGTGGTSAGVGSGVGWFCGAKWTRNDTIFHATDNSTTIEQSIDGGYTWSTEFFDSAIALAGICTRETSAKAGATAACGTTAGDNATIVLTGGDATTANGWMPHDLPGSGVGNAALTICADPYVSDVFLIGGNDEIAGGVTPCVWRVVAPLGDFDSETKILMDTPSPFPIRIVCAGSTYKLCAAWSGVVNLMWRWQDGDTTATPITVPTLANEIKAILWLPEDELFLVIADAGPGVEFWTSATGASGSWTQIDTMAGGTALFGVASTNVGASCVRGSIIMVPLLWSGSGFVAISGDAGATWEIGADPLARHGENVARCFDLGSRFLAGGYSGGGVCVWAASLRAG